MLLVLLILHIAAGTVGIIAGFAIIFLKKGQQIHKHIGWIFMVTMLILGTSGIIIAVAKNIPLSMLNGGLVCYLVLSSFITIRAKIRFSSMINQPLFGVGLILLIGYSYYFYLAFKNSPEPIGGFGPSAFAIFGLITFYALSEDLYFMFRNTVAGKVVLIRHLWRMLLPLFMASAAVFLGQAKLFPTALAQSGALFIPVIFVLLSLLYWIIKISFQKKWAYQ